MNLTSQEAINGRFIKAVRQIVALDVAKGGELTSRNAVAKSIGIDQASLPHRPGRNATAPACAKLCAVHGISPAWLLLGEGEMMLDKELAAQSRMDAIEQRLRALEGK